MTIIELLQNENANAFVQGLNTRLICYEDRRFEVLQRHPSTGSSYQISHYDGKSESDAVMAFLVSEGLKND